ncbi:4-(cytidine 5'-diphospho)-2-C-methyl-D-erythritol kinase [Neisseria meningitidis]|uniref:4-(cytidine 5'-diphospho)-2-C-methyl-D-erythritol kinase n=1 Tax=Neisseria meningitidis TaxID=487 RepID=UPI000FCC5823|nr:4-(cytidine 5'-diphospho)-2-C-methyl-D-erythritol kinase [Neisseria meningitidis]
MNIADGRQAFPAPAKLNLDLRITGRREDGYHNIESIFCLIDLQDTVYLKLRDDGKIILHNPVDGMPQEVDLSYRAASLLQKYAHNPAGVEIWLDKKIPTGAGLGGGSAGGATVLLVLNRWWQCGLTQRQLIDSGAALGADVPFFIFGKNAFARGIGDRLDEMDIPKQWYVIVKPPVHVSTAKIFTHEGLTRNSASSIMPTFQNLQPFRNDMQAVVFKEYPEVWKAYSELSRYGFALMTGSGACVFTACQDRNSAYNIYRQVSDLYEAYLAEGLSKHPLLSV